MIQDQNIDLFNRFMNFEFDNNLFNCKVSDINFWHLVRFRVFDKIQYKSFEIGDSHTHLNSMSKTKKTFLKLKQLKYFLLNNPLLSFKQKDIVILSHPRRIKEKAYYTCLYTDTLIGQLDHSHVVIEEPILENHLRPIKNKKIFYTDYINFMVAIKKRVLKNFFL